jgi:hypothetical protein
MNDRSCGSKMVHAALIQKLYRFSILHAFSLGADPVSLAPSDDHVRIKQCFAEKRRAAYFSSHFAGANVDVWRKSGVVPCLTTSDMSLLNHVAGIRGN